MNYNTLSPTHFQNATVNYEETCSKMNLNEVFAEKHGPYLNELTLYLAHFNVIPNVISEIKIDCKKAHKWFAEKYKNDITSFYYNKRHYKQNKTSEIDDIFYILFEDMLVDFDTNCSIVRFLFRNTQNQKVDEIINGIKKFKEKRIKRKPEISFLVSTNRGIDTKGLQIPRPKLSLEDNYNDDFKDIHQIIIKRLSKKNDKGLILLHGRPGTGKTSYIRYLVSSLKKNVIFMPPNMAGSITNPDLISILIDNPNSILVIEDAENIVIDREKNENSPVSVLLNISDGLLSDCLNIQIICSFNTDISKVDSALMRKGRLIAKYEFKELDVEKANLLSQKLGYKNVFHSPVPLTAVYNQNEKEFLQIIKPNPIGFRI